MNDTYRLIPFRNGSQPLAKQTLATVSKRLDDQRERAWRLFEYGECGWETFCKRRDEITEQKSQLI